MNKESHNRLFAQQSSSFRQYAENYEEITRICEETGRKPAEVLRDAIDEWICMRRAGVFSNAASAQYSPNSDSYAKFEEIQRAIERLIQKIDKLTESYEDVEQRDHGYLLEILMASYAARDMIWMEISNRMRLGKHTEEEIQSRYNALEQEWRERTYAKIEEIRNIILNREEQ
jgi:hypothetical protein